MKILSLKLQLRDYEYGLIHSMARYVFFPGRISTSQSCLYMKMTAFWDVAPCCLGVNLTFQRCVLPPSSGFLWRRV
jgi:hypothetical protein